MHSEHRSHLHLIPHSGIIFIGFPNSSTWSLQSPHSSDNVSYNNPRSGVGLHFNALKTSSCPEATGTLAVAFVIGWSSLCDLLQQAPGDFAGSRQSIPRGSRDPSINIMATLPATQYH